MYIGYRICLLRHRMNEWLEPLPSDCLDFALYPSDYGDLSINDPLRPEERLERNAKLDQFCKELEEINDSLDKWYDSIPGEWWPTIVHVPERRDDVWNQIAHDYQRPLAAPLHSFAQALRLITNGLYIKAKLRQDFEAPVTNLFQIQIAVGRSH